MFFSANQYYNYVMAQPPTHRAYAISPYLSRPIRGGAKVTKAMCAEALRNVKSKILFRDRDEYTLRKWIRPWDIVPELQRFAPPRGDYGVGVEIELGFTSLGAAKKAVRHIKDWKYVAIDFEGGAEPIEATFAPGLYSQFNGRSQPCRYLDFLANNSSLVVPHDPASTVGTHVNVSKGGVDFGTSPYLFRTNYLTDVLRSMSMGQKVKFFGRSPYHVYLSNQHRFIEYKLFNSVTDSLVLRRYVDTAVALTALLTDEDKPINASFVLEALEKGYAKGMRRDLRLRSTVAC